MKQNSPAFSNRVWITILLITFLTLFGLGELYDTAMRWLPLLFPLIVQGELLFRYMPDFIRLRRHGELPPEKVEKYRKVYWKRLSLTPEDLALILKGYAVFQGFFLLSLLLYGLLLLLRLLPVSSYQYFCLALAIVYIIWEIALYRICQNRRRQFSS